MRNLPYWHLLRRPKLTPALKPSLALFLKCSRSNSHRHTYNAGLFNVISRKTTPYSASVTKANKVCSRFNDEIFNSIFDELTDG